MQQADSPKITKENTSSTVPNIEITRKKTKDKLAHYKRVTDVADKIAEFLPTMQSYVDKRLLAIKTTMAFGIKADSEVVSNWSSTDKILRQASDNKRGLSATNKQAKEVLWELVKRAEKMALLSSEKAYLEGEKICYLAEKEFSELEKMIDRVEERIKWIKTQGFIDAGETTTVKRGLKKNK